MERGCVRGWNGGGEEEREVVESRESLKGKKLTFGEVVKIVIINCMIISEFHRLKVIVKLNWME